MLAAATLQWTNATVARLSYEWKSEVPLSMHRMGERGLGSDGNPQWTQEFEFYLTRGIGRAETDTRPDDWEERNIHERRGPYQQPPARVRTTRAFRKLRRHSNAEFIVAYRLCVLDPPLYDHKNLEASSRSFSGALNRTVHWLNQRAVQRETGETYTFEQVALLAYAAAEKLNSWA